MGGNSASAAAAAQREPLSSDAIQGLSSVLLVLDGLAVTRSKENVNMGQTFDVDMATFVFALITDATQAIGASPISDGVYDGTLSVFSKAVEQWQAAKPTGLKGVTSKADAPIIGGYSWLTQILPYVGRNDLYLKFDFSKSWTDRKSSQLTAQVIPAFLNPMDTRLYWQGYPLQGMALTHFVGMSGVEDRRNVVAAALPRSDPRAGIFGYDSIAKPSEITDGTSQTIMIIGSGQSLVAPWVQGGGATIRGARAPYFDKHSGFGSVGAPNNGVFVMFADGSCRAISSDIAPEIFKAMCTMHGAEQIDLSKVVP